MIALRIRSGRRCASHIVAELYLLKVLQLIIIPYRAANFGPSWGPCLSGKRCLCVSWEELVWAAVTVGKPGIAYLLAHGWHSVSDVIIRSHTVYANLRQTSIFCEKSTLYDALDPTEKGAISYFVGMMAAKVLSARLLNTPWLFHLSMLPAKGGTPALHGKSEPDLIGRNRKNDWIVVEAKGRTRGYSGAAMSAAKAQTRRLRMINGSYPALRVGIQAYFSPELRFAMVDPDDFDVDAHDLNFDFRTALRMYYSAADAWTQGVAESRRLNNREFIARTNDEVGVTIGIDKYVKERLEADTPQAITTRADQNREVASDAGQDFTVFPDGLAIALDERWSEQRMRREPLQRRGN